VGGIALHFESLRDEQQLAREGATAISIPENEPARGKRPSFIAP
jgi:hypothetical protein